jgi:hypothetical protein
MTFLKSLRLDVEYMADHVKEVLTLVWLSDAVRTEHLPRIDGRTIAINVPTTIEHEQRIEYPSRNVVDYYAELLKAQL